MHTSGNNETLTPTFTATAIWAGPYSTSTAIANPFGPTLNVNQSTPTQGEVFILEDKSPTTTVNVTPAVNEFTSPMPSYPKQSSGQNYGFILPLIGLFFILTSVGLYFYVSKKK
jgi:hypothetical protein